MPPKGKKPLNRKRAVPTENVPETLVQKEELQESLTSPGKRKAPRRDLDAMVEKMLKDNFRGWSSQQIDCSPIGGLTLRQVLVRDKELCVRGQLKMGKNYYQALRAKFESAAAPSRQLTVRDAEEPVNTKLRSALVELMGNRWNMQPLLSWLGEDEEINQRSLVALLNASLDLRPAAGPKHTNCLVEVMQILVRNGYHEKFPADVGVLRNHFDATLVKSFMFMKKNEVSLDVFFQTHKHILCLVCDVTAFEACMLCKSAWNDVRDDLSKVVGNSLVGETIFGKAFDSLKHDRATMSIKRLVEKFQTTEKNVDAESVKDYRQQFIAESKAAGDDPFASFPKKLVGITYRGFNLQVGVNSSLEHYTLAMSSAMKEVAVRNGSVPQLFCEDALAAPVQPYDMVIAKDLLAPDVNARHAANKFLDHMDEINCDAIAKVLVAKHAVLVAIDPCFKVEEAF